MRVWLRDADAAQSRVFLPANKPASKHRANVQGVYSQIVDRSLMGIGNNSDGIIPLAWDLKNRYFVVHSTSKNIINAQLLLLKETHRHDALAMIVRIHGKSHGLSYVPLISNAMKGRYEIEYTERIYLFIFLLDEKWNEKSP